MGAVCRGMGVGKGAFDQGPALSKAPATMQQPILPCPPKVWHLLRCSNPPLHARLKHHMQRCSKRFLYA